MKMKAASKILFFISILLQGGFAFSQVLNDYRSVVTGNWNALATWQSYNGVAWVAATVLPTAAVAQTITIQSPNIVTITAAVSVDQVVINSGATLQTSAAIVLTIAAGAGDDLTVNGTFIDASSGSIVWSAGTTWLMGAAGTLIKTTISAATGWQGNYSGGIATIPATANWIIRRNTAVNPVITTIGAYYPNLTIENNVAGIWTTATTSTFQGTTGFPTIKGNFDIGGSGTSTVDFLNGHTFATPSLVQGNTIIRAGNILRNYGTGLEMQGDLTVSGTVNYAAGAGTRKIIFSGGNAQSISGAGTLNIRDMTMSKSANSLTLNRAITIDNVLTMTTGIINSSSPTNFPTINTAGTVAGANNASFVNGPVRYIGTAAFTFPVGKGSDYQPLGYGATGGGGVFWTENFNPAGIWTTTNTGANSASANTWYIRVVRKTVCQLVLAVRVVLLEIHYTLVQLLLVILGLRMMRHKQLTKEQSHQ